MTIATTKRNIGHLRERLGITASFATVSLEAHALSKRITALSTTGACLGTWCTTAIRRHNDVSHPHVLVALP